MNIGTCSAEKLYNDKFAFLIILETIEMNSIDTSWKLANHSFVDILEDFVKGFDFYFIKSMSTIDYSFDNEFSQGCFLNNMFITDFNSTLI